MRTFSLFAGLLFFVSLVQAQKEMSIAQVQGEGNASSAVDQRVRLTGVVTARTSTGFFLQTPDDKADANKNTSEGIFVFTRTEPPVEADNGNIVSVTGTVEEFRRESDILASTITELSMRKDRDELKVISKSNALPKPIVLTAADFMSNSVDVLEKYEGMRVQIDEMTATSPTGGRVDIKNFSSVSNRTFFAVIKPVPRPYREPGRDVRELATAADKEKYKKEFPKAAIFDSNPDVLRIDCDEQLPSLTQRLVPNRCEAWAGTDVKNVVGVLHYSYAKFAVLVDPDAQVTISSPKKAIDLPVPTGRQFIVAGMNLENFFDDEDDPDIKEDIATPEAFARRLNKISRAIREFMQSPDVIGIVEAESLPALKRLASKLNADTVAAGKPDPKYEGFLVDGNDGRGIDNGFLVKTSRVKVVETKQFGKEDKYKNPNTKEDNFLNDRPPLMLRASINDAKTAQPFEFTVIVNHLKSFLGYNDPKQMDNVRLKKKLQAEFLARLIQARQTANPKERIIVLGDFNSFQFPDGVMDLIGTITGKPAAKDEVLIASEDLVNPDLINLVGAIAPPQRYSYIFDGNAQVLDHILISETLRKHTTGFGYARINADHPEILRNEGNRYERFSDHDPAIAFFTMDDMTAARSN
jgi:predicted extracellular nuclease